MYLMSFYRFRGICDSTLYDERFVMTGTVNGKPYFRGYYRSHIYYTDRRTWRLENIMVRIKLSVALNLFCDFFFFFHGRVPRFKARSLMASVGIYYSAANLITVVFSKLF